MIFCCLLHLMFIFCHLLQLSLLSPPSFLFLFQTALFRRFTCQVCFSFSYRLLLLLCIDTTINICFNMHLILLYSFSFCLSEKCFTCPYVLTHNLKGRVSYFEVFFFSFWTLDVLGPDLSHDRLDGPHQAQASGSCKHES